MRLQPLKSIRTSTLLTYTTVFRSGDLDPKPHAGIQIIGRHPETAARDLLDDRIGVVAVLVRRVARAVFPAFARHGLSADAVPGDGQRLMGFGRSEEHTSELQSLMHISYAVFCSNKKHNLLEHHGQSSVNNIKHTPVNLTTTLH